MTGEDQKVTAHRYLVERYAPTIQPGKEENTSVKQGRKNKARTPESMRPACLCVARFSMADYTARRKCSNA
jgi:hypothetical protein